MSGERLTWTGVEQVAVPWRDGVVSADVMLAVNERLEASDLDGDEKDAVLGSIEDAMNANGGDLYTVADLPARIQRLLGL